MAILIIESEPVVLMDMFAILRQNFPTSGVEYAFTTAEASQLASQKDDLTVVVVGPSVKMSDENALTDIIRQKSANVVVAYDGSEERLSFVVDNGWIPLEVPFTNNSFLDAMHRTGLMPQPSEHPESPGDITVH